MKKLNSENWKDYCTIGQLRRNMKGLPDDTPVFYERIEDPYFKKGTGWSEGLVYIPNDIEPSDKKYDSQYIRAWWGGKGKKRNGKKIIFLITAHY